MGRLYFVRHGETYWNVENKICGATDIALTERGHNQAVETGRLIIEQGLLFDEILSSPLVRAFETARDGEDFQKAKQHFLDHYGNGESMMKLGQRIYNLLDDICRDDKTYLLVAHNGIARVIQSYFYDMTNEEYAAFGVKNCAVLEYTW